MSNAEVSMSEKVRGKGVGFQYIRRITGYLVGDLSRFNSGKRAEEHDRVKHDKFLNVDSGINQTFSENAFAEQKVS